MAKNLRAKIPTSDTLIIIDECHDVMIRFIEENRKAAESSAARTNSRKVEIARNARELAEKSVSGIMSFLLSKSGMHPQVLQLD